MRNRQLLARTELAYARSDDAPGATERRARTRRLIELGGLVEKSGLAARLGDNRAAVLGALLDAADRAENPDTALSFLDRGLRAFNVLREEQTDERD